MAVYRHFKDKAAILDSLVDHALVDVELPASEGDSPRQALVDAFAAAHDQLALHPGLSMLVAHSVRTSASIRSLAEYATLELAKCPLSGSDRRRLHHTLMAITIGSLAMELEDPGSDHPTPEGIEAKISEQAFRQMLGGVLAPLDQGE